MQKRPLFAAMTPTTETKLDRVLTDKDLPVVQARLDHAKTFFEAVTVFVDLNAEHDFRKIDICCQSTVELFDAIVGWQAFDLDDNGLPDEWIPSNAFALGEPLKALMTHFLELALGFQGLLAKSAFSSVTAAVHAVLKQKTNDQAIYPWHRAPQCIAPYPTLPASPVRHSFTPTHCLSPLLPDPPPPTRARAPTPPSHTVSRHASTSD